MIIELTCAACGSTDLGDCCYLARDPDTYENKLSILVPICRCQRQPAEAPEKGNIIDVHV